MKLLMNNHQQKGKLITFCGLDGCGKTTQINLLSEFLESLGLPVKIVKQPTDFVRSSEMFRSFQDGNKNEKYDYRAVSLLCASDRIQHCTKTILPLLRENYIVISDRYFYSCVANLHARGYEADTWIYYVSQYIPKPDYAFFLDVDVDTAIYRVRQRPNEKNKYIDKEFQNKLRNLYLELANKNDGIVIDSSTPPAATFAKILSAIEKI